MAVTRTISIQWLVVGALTVPTITAWLGRLHPILELTANARPVFVVMAGLAALGLLITGHRAPAALAAVVLVINAVHLAPYVLAEPDPEQPGAVPLRALQYNIYY